MANANVILLNSILWNLREVAKLAEKIKKDCGDVDCTSWRYPLTRCSQLEIFKLLQNNRSLDSYTYILELTYDRLLYVFNLMIKYLESSESMEKFRPGRNVHRPTTLSLASVLHMIWERIKAQREIPSGLREGEGALEKVREEAEEDKKDIQVRASRSSTCTQSEVSAISVCSCCEMAQDFVTQLVLEMEKIFEKQEFDSAISQQRLEMKEYLVEMTNWSAMSKWLAAIIKDLTSLSKKAEEATLNSRNLSQRLDTGEREMKSKAEQHEEETRKLNARLREHETRIEELSKEKVRLNKELKAKNSEMILAVSDFEKKMIELKKSFEKKLSEKKEKKLKNDREKEAEWRRKLDAETKRREALETENGNLCEKVRQLEETLNFKTEEEKARWELLESEVENLREENSNLYLAIKEKQTTIDDYSSRMMAAFPELINSTKTKYKATGNPAIDMENQIEANKLRIDLLKTENEKLSLTLDKLRAVQG